MALSGQESEIRMEIDGTQLQILYAARDSFPEGTTTTVIAKETGIDYRTIMVECEYLADRNFIEITEWGPKVHSIRIMDKGKQILKNYYSEGKPTGTLEQPKENRITQ